MVVAHSNLFNEVLDYKNRANPYPFFAQMRKTPVFVQDDGRYIVSRYTEINEILHDPRFSSDMRKSYSKLDQRTASEGPEGPSFVFLDPPRHDWLRHQVMSKFTPELIYSQAGRLDEVVKELLDSHQQTKKIDIVDDIAYPVPVTIICEILGVPREDEHLFHSWADQLILGNDPEQGNKIEVQELTKQATQNIRKYTAELITKIMQQSRTGEATHDGLLAAMLNDTSHEKRMNSVEMVDTAILLLVAGHETTVNLIANSMLTLLRNPGWLEKLRQNPSIGKNIVEEVLRYDPPVQLLRRTPLTDVTIAGITMPTGAPVYLLNASANHDPLRFADPDTFNPDRSDIEHLGFGGGIHYCVGAPLARLETQATLTALARRLEHPRLLVDPPEYRLSAGIRAPRHLLVSYDKMRTDTCQYQPDKHQT